MPKEGGGGWMEGVLTVVFCTEQSVGRWSSSVERERVFCFKFIALKGLLLSWDMHATNIIK